VTEPEQAVEQARAALGAMRESGAYGERAARDPAPPDAVPQRKLLQWALVDPDIGNVRSTRRLGAPVTVLKRALLRLLRQYHQELTAEQARFNFAVAEHVSRLEARLEELERRLQDGEKPR
jgi:hypothetical protein